MGTNQNERQNLWSELDTELKMAGISRGKFGEWYFYEINDIGTSDEAASFAATFKKQCKRQSLSPLMIATVEDYLNKLCDHPIYEAKIGRVATRSIKYPETDDASRRGMARISVKIDEMIEENRDDEF